MNDIRIGLGGEIEVSQPTFVPPKEAFTIDIPEKIEFKESSTIDSGFGHDNKLHFDCPKPKTHIHLCKENYLSEFKTESEKQLARDNLGVYSKSEVNNALIDILQNLDSNTFITRKEVNNLIDNLDFVKSILKSNIDYEIPETLFTL